MSSSSSSSSSSLPLFLNPPLLSAHRSKHFLPFSHFFFSNNKTASASHLCLASSFSSSYQSPDDNKDFLWLREEQRWLREEQRWIREEQRWLRERESLLNEIESLKIQIKALEQRISVQEVDLVPETIADVRALLSVLSEKNMIAESGLSSSPESLNPDPDPSPIVVEEKKEVISIVEDKKRKITLRNGSEGEEVKAMQEALLALGFYSGEEDMEFSSFSSGTERAVKTWQSTLGAPEDGIMTEQLLERLYVEQQAKLKLSSTDQKESTTLPVSPKGGANGAAVASVTEISETQQKIVKEDGGTEVKASQQRVFLLGENRWEEPSRLVGKDKQVGASKPKGASIKCLSCRGEGRLLCTECDGSGQPNVEPQFLEWVGEGAKCPYCEGLGYTICDVCEGKTVV